ncbi:hypothetical protein [Mariniphaga sediminis]|uniref:hypothetical protein n=1 Tax=Mariniphaga sediminis TaxID=1628158 RepID=UPI0035649E95
MGVISKFERDFERATHIFPKLKYRKVSKANMWVVSGEIDICDKVGCFWETFSVAIYVPISYPYCKPTVREISNIIPRSENWHINDNGECCVDIEHNLLIYKKRGFNILDFIKNKVYPYFANQVFKEKSGEYAAGEYQHYFDGIRQFYREKLNIKSDILQKLITNKLPSRNELCICGKKKYKYCHLKSIEFLRSLPLERLKKDMDEFSNLIV